MGFHPIFGQRFSITHCKVFQTTSFLSMVMAPKLLSRRPLISARMARAVARGRALLASPVAFQPCVNTVIAVRFLVSWTFSCGHFHFLGFVTVTSALFMRQPRFRPQQLYRPLQALSPECSFILSGGGIAVDLQFQIFSFLYTPDTVNVDLASLGLAAPALKLVTQSWTQVDTPSVASPLSNHGQ